MPRSLRTDFVGAWHHVMNRGAGRAEAFSDDVDAESFLDGVGEAAVRYDVGVHAYCLMPNHFHLLVHSRAGRLSEFVRFATGRFSRTKNKRAHRDGPQFRGRFNSKLVESEPHLLECNRYIHLNPVKGGLATSPEDWPWSSARAYLGSASSPSWLITQDMLAMFGRLGAERRYRDFLMDGLAGNDGVRPGGSDTA
jgi:REP element-mobilizing transposase RayT